MAHTQSVWISIVGLAVIAIVSFTLAGALLVATIIKRMTKDDPGFLHDFGIWLGRASVVGLVLCAGQAFLAILGLF